MTTTLPTPESLGLVMPQADRPMASYNSQSDWWTIFEPAR